MTSLLTVVRDRYDQLTPLQRRLATHVMEHHRAVGFMTAQELAAAAHVSDAAVVRFAQALGFRGFPEMRASLRQDLLQQTGAFGVAEASGDLRMGPELIQRVYQLDRELIKATAGLNDWTVFRQLAERLCRARKIWVTGHGTTYPMAHYLAMSLHQALGNTEMLQVGSGELPDRVRGVGSADVMIGITFVRYFRYTTDILRMGRDRGAHIAVITDSLSATPARLADEVLLVMRDGVSFLNWSHAATIGVINVLLAAVALEGGDRVRTLMRESDELLRTQQLVEDSGRP